MIEQDNIIIQGQVDIDQSAIISPFTIIGYGGDPSEIKERHKDNITTINSGVWIGPFVTIYQGAMIGADVKIDPYSRIGHNTKIGNGARILYGA